MNAGLLTDLISKDGVPVLAPLTHDGKGSMLNTNADTIAGEAAKALAEYFDVTLIYCFEKDGVLRDENDDNSVIEKITPEIFAALKDAGIVQGGLIPTLENSFKAIDAGVKEVIIPTATSLGTDKGTHIPK